MAMTSAPTDRVDEIAALLTTCGPTKFGAEFLAKNDACPRYVWIPTDDIYGNEVDVEFGSIELGTMGAFAQNFTVEIWGIDYPTTWRMRAALVTAVRQIMARAYRIGGCQWINGGPDQKGWKALQDLTLLIPLIEQDVPAVLGAAISDGATPTAQATAVRRVTTHFE